MKRKLLLIRGLFAIVGLYDFLLGAAFLIAGPSIFAKLTVTPPNHWGYIHFPASLLVIFGMMFLAVARRPSANRNLIPYGVLLKIAYCGVVLYHHLAGGGVPQMWLVFGGLDAVAAVLMAATWTMLGARDQT